VDDAFLMGVLDRLADGHEVVGGGQEGVNASPQVWVALARPVQVGTSLLLGRQLEGLGKDRLSSGLIAAIKCSWFVAISQCAVCARITPAFRKKSDGTARRSLAAPKPVVEPATAEHPVPFGRAPGESVIRWHWLAIA